MSDREALLSAAALLANHRPLMGQREQYDAFQAHVRPLVLERNREFLR